jgi:nitrogenase-stabilizing/protective protein
MSKTLVDFQKLNDAEQFFEFFELPYDAKVVNVNRLHILQKFSQAIAQIEATTPDLSEAEKLEQYQTALEQAYAVFLSSNSLEQKLFKVFNQKPQNLVLLTDIGAEE